MLFTGAARRALYLCLAALPALAQFESGNVPGTVHDPSSAVISKAPGPPAVFLIIGTCLPASCR